MRSRSPLRRNTVLMHRYITPDAVRSVRTRLRPNLESLERRQLLSGVDLSFEFGSLTSPTAPDYTAVNPSITYSSALGYGWSQGSSIQATDRGTGSDINRSFDFTTTSMTFEVALPNGTYNVSLTSGDAESPQGPAGIFVGEDQVDTITTKANQFVSATYEATVTNGVLNLTLEPLAGGTGYAVINALAITQTNASTTATAGSPVASNNAAPSVIPSTPSGGESGVAANSKGGGSGATNASGSTPYGGTPWPVPGIIQAENFDNGGKGVAYFDTTRGNAGGAYRSTDVDIQATSDTGGGYNVGWIAATRVAQLHGQRRRGGNLPTQSTRGVGGPGRHI